MGQFSEGQLLDWEQVKKFQEYVRKHGIMEFINVYKKMKNRPDDELKWGDEIEYTIVKFDNAKQTAKVHFNSHNLITRLNEKEERDPKVQCLWRPEYSSYQLETTPGKPYGGLLSDFLNVEKNMRLRRLEALEIIGSDECLMTITAFPRLGCPNFSEPPTKPAINSAPYESLFIPENAIFINNDRNRWRMVNRNMALRRAECFSINMPIYRDENVPRPFRENLATFGDDGSRQKEVKDDHIFMDSLSFGMGCCCLQVTLQARNIKKAFVLYDQLTAFCPIMVALTAAAPTFRGYLTDADSRWIAIKNSCDDRTREERGLEPLKLGEKLRKDGRNGFVEWYLSEEGQQYNDVTLEYDDKWLNLLLKNGIEKPLAQHIAHLFDRDCMLIEMALLDGNDESNTHCFESMQSTTWRSMRFKPPPPNSDIGWRVEFRPMDVQLTDFENAAAACFVILLSKIILSYNLNTLIPLSKVEENMMRAQKRDAVNQQKFWFRKDILSTKESKNSGIIEEEYEEFTIEEIIIGKEGIFVGILPLIKSYLCSMNVDVDTYNLIERYINVYKARATGKLLTGAAWIRKQILNHPDYRKDAVVTEKINYDLLKDIYELGLGRKSCPELVGPISSQTTTIKKSIN